MKREYGSYFMTFFAGMFIGMAILGQISSTIDSSFSDMSQWENLHAATDQSEVDEIFGHYIEFIVEHEIDWDSMTIYAKIDRSIMRGSDAECQFFGQMMEHITRHGFMVHVTNEGFIPSTKNPIDHEWAVVLAKGY